MTISRTLVLSLLCSLALHAAAQNNSGIIRGSLKDAVSKQVLPLATVTVFTAKDTTIITYRLSDASGNFKVPGIPLDRDCRVLVSFSGYKVYRKNFTLSKENPLLDMGTIFLVNDPQSLDEVIVYAERPPVVVRKDTIEFNASAFKTLPGALLEDLLKKLPGLEIDGEGNILVKGKTVNKLLVDGKEFFGSDPQIATKNLPADIVDKVQVMNDQEEIRRNPHLPESKIGQVINIKLKKAIKQGWFGKAYAGGGTDSRHEAGAILNAFRDTVQVSVLGYTNNVNRPGFGVSDIQKLGGFDRSGFNSMMITNEGGFSINDISLGGTGQGLQRSTGGGVNFNDQFGEKLTLNLQYFYGQINSKLSNLSNQQRFFQDTVLTTRSSSEFASVGINHRIGATVKWKIDSLTTLTFKPGITLAENRNASSGMSAAQETYRGKVNSSQVDSRGNSTGNNYAYNLFLDKSFKKKGRTFSVNADLSSLNNNADDYTDGMYSTYNSGTAADSLVNQLRKAGGNTLNSTVTVSYAEPLGKKLTLEVSHTIQYVKQDNGIDFFSKNRLNEKYDQYNQDLSNGVERKGWKNTSSAALVLGVKNIYIRPGINYLTAAYKNSFTKSPLVSQQFNYVYPSLNVYWGIFNVSYNAYIREPPASDLQPVIDVSNRFYQQYGNPNLKPAFTQSLTLNVYKYDPETGNSFTSYIGGDFHRNGTMRETGIDPNGIQTARPVNVNGNRYVYGNVAYNYQYKLSRDYKASIRASLFGSYNKTTLSVNGHRSGQESFDVYPSLSLNLNFKDKIELNQRYSPGYKQTAYNDRANYKNIYVRSHSTESELVIRMPKRIVWENLVNYTYNPQVAPGIRKSSVRWNAAVNYLFLKDNKGQLKLSVYDLLKQNINVFRYINENYISDTQNTTLTRYFMLTFTYNLRNFTGGKVGGQDRRMFFF
ncbi:MAG: outer membrane beta-barrel protein [Williamsia sp.]|nr:outer membrane beta-barrel protein [Williamsia sp.]